MIIIEDMIEEYMLWVIMKNTIVLKRSQEIPGVKVMLQINLNIFLFLHFLVPLPRILPIVGWLIVAPLIIFLGIMMFSLIWWGGSQVWKLFLETTPLIPWKFLSLLTFIWALRNLFYFMMWCICWDWTIIWYLYLLWKTKGWGFPSSRKNYLLGRWEPYEKCIHIGIYI